MVEQEIYRILLDQSNISAVINKYCTAIDLRDWDLLASCFAEDLVADFRSFGSREIVKGRDAWIDVVRGTVGGLDATQHLTSNHVYELNGDDANFTAYVQAVHVLANEFGDSEYTIGGYYECALSRREDDWVIANYSLNVTWQRGNRHILRLARQQSG